MANEQFRLVGITGGAAGRIPGDFTEREEMMDALAEAQSSAKFDTITVQKRTKSPTTGKFSSWVDAEKFPGNRLRQEAAQNDAADEVPPPPSDQRQEKITYCVQVKHDGQWDNVLVTEDKMSAAKRAQVEMTKPENEELSLIQYDANSTAPDRGVTSLLRKALKQTKPAPTKSAETEQTAENPEKADTNISQPTKNNIRVLGRDEFIAAFRASVSRDANAHNKKHSEIIKHFDGILSNLNPRWHFYTNPWNQFRWMLFVCNLITFGVVNKTVKKTLLWNMYYRQQIADPGLIYDAFGGDVVDFDSEIPLFFYKGSGDNGCWLITSEKACFTMFEGKSLATILKKATKTGYFRFSDVKSIKYDTSGLLSLNFGVIIDGKFAGAIYYDEKGIGAQTLAEITSYLRGEPQVAADAVQRALGVANLDIGNKIAAGVETVKAKAKDIDTDEVRKKLERNVQAVKDLIPDEGKQRTKGFFTRWCERASEPGAKPNWKDMLIVFFATGILFAGLDEVSHALSLVVVIISIIYYCLWYKNKKLFPGMLFPFPHPYARNIIFVLIFAALSAGAGISDKMKQEKIGYSPKQVEPAANNSNTASRKPSNTSSATSTRGEQTSGEADIYSQLEEARKETAAYPIRAITYVELIKRGCLEHGFSVCSKQCESMQQSIYRFAEQVLGDGFANYPNSKVAPNFASHIAMLMKTCEEWQSARR